MSAVPIYLLARHRLGNPWLALALGVAWLLNPSVQWLCWEAWHPETMAIPFLLSAYLFASREQWRWYWVALVIAAVVEGGHLHRRRGAGRRAGPVRTPPHRACSRSASSVVWFLVAYGVIMPHFNGGTNQAGIFYGDLGSSPTELARTAVSDPGAVLGRLQDNDALGYARDLLAPFGFVPVLAPGIAGHRRCRSSSPTA